MTTSLSRVEERVLIYALFGGDAQLTTRILQRAGFDTHVCMGIDELCDAIGVGAGAVVLVEEALVPEAQTRILEVLEGQPPWSDLPFIVSSSERDVPRPRASQVSTIGALANVTFLERPVPVRALLSAVHASLRGRRRQYQARTLLGELAASETRFREVQEQSPQGMMILRPVRDEANVIVDFHWVYANPTSARTIGLTNEELVGKSILSERPNVLTERRFDAYVRAYESGSNNGEYREFLSERGADQRAYRNVAFRLDGDLVIMFEDITERKRAEEERAVLLKREKELRARAEISNQLKDEFLATVSHELRTPLNAILGWARMLNHGGLDAITIKRALQSIERNASAQTRLIEDLLDVSRIVSGKLRLDLGEVRLHAVIGAAIDSIQPALNARQTRLDCALDDDADVVMGDPTRLQQIVWNLLSNAAKFTSNGGHIEVSLHRVGNQVELDIMDDGQGFDPDFGPYLFQRFRQADGTRTRAHGGLGLGLAICRHLVELHGGTIEAQSDGVGKGARFLVRLPMRASQPLHNEPPSIPGAEARVAPFEAPGELRGLKVLLVDDEPDARELLAMVLSRCGAIPIEASSVAEAMDAMQTHPDLVVSDIGMPREDGYELIRRIRSLPTERGGRVPAAALTAFAHRDDKRRALNAGFEMHICKPIEPSELVTSLAALARIGRGASAGEPD